MTIYEVMYEFLEAMFPSAIVTEYTSLLTLTAIFMTYCVVFGLIIMPLWRLAMFFIKGGKRR